MGNISAVSAISNAGSSAGCDEHTHFGSRRKSMTSSSLRVAENKTNYGSDIRSPFRTRDRSDEYFRSLPHESSRHISFHEDVIHARRTRTPMKVAVSEKMPKSPNRQRQAASLYQLSDGAKALLLEKGSYVAGSPPRSSQPKAATSTSTPVMPMALPSPPHTYSNLHKKREKKEAAAK